MMAKLDLVNERTKHKFVLEGKVDVIGSVADVVFAEEVLEESRAPAVQEETVTPEEMLEGAQDDLQ